MKKYIPVYWKMGTHVRHAYSQFEGRIVAKCEYENGQTSYGVRPKCDDPNKFPEMTWIDGNDLIYPIKPKKAAKAKRKAK